MEGADAGFSHHPAVVKWFNADKEFGFLEGGLSEDIFIHRNVLKQAKIHSINQGDTLICDIAPGTKGRFQVIAVHNVIRRGASPSELETWSEPVEGTVEFFNAQRGYGFIKTMVLPEDVYVSQRVLEQGRLRTLSPGTKVKVSVEPGQHGKGFSATSLEVIQ